MRGSGRAWNALLGWVPVRQGAGCAMAATPTPSLLGYSFFLPLTILGKSIQVWTLEGGGILAKKAGGDLKWEQSSCT